MNLKTAKELKEVAEEFGVKLPKNTYWINKKALQFIKSDGDYPAYTTDELLEWLPTFITIWKSDAGYSCGEEYGKNHKIQHPTPSEALALLAIELIKKGVIK